MEFSASNLKISLTEDQPTLLRSIYAGLSHKSKVDKYQKTTQHKF
jgi:hypothetical protein